MRLYWGAIVADFRREYRVTDIAALGLWEFRALLANLSEASMWRYLVREHPHEVDAAEAAAITAAARA